jgi:putative PIN family toxin of toxin-antitoxin system
VPPSQYRIVLDTNIVIRGFVNRRSASGEILMACEQRRAIPLLSKPVLDEYRSIIRRPAIVQRYPELKRTEVEVSLERLLYVSDFYGSITRRFSFPRDPKDAPFLELAITGHATHLITADNDLLALAGGRDETSKRFRRQIPGISVVKPEEFASRHRAAIMQTPP